MEGTTCLLELPKAVSFSLHSLLGGRLLMAHNSSKVPIHRAYPQNWRPYRHCRAFRCCCQHRCCAFHCLHNHHRRVAVAPSIAVAIIAIVLPSCCHCNFHCCRNCAYHFRHRHCHCIAIAPTIVTVTRCCKSLHCCCRCIAVAVALPPHLVCRCVLDILCGRNDSCMHMIDHFHV